MSPQNNISWPAAVLGNKTDNTKLLAGHTGHMKLLGLAVGPKTSRYRIALSCANCSHVLIRPLSIRSLDKIETVVFARKHFRQRTAGWARFVETPLGKSHRYSGHSQHEQ